MLYFALFTLTCFTVTTTQEIDNRTSWSGRTNGISTIQLSGSSFYAGSTSNGCSGLASNSECIRVESFRISGDSDRYRPGGTYGGIIVYDTGFFNRNRRRGQYSIRPGLVHFADTSNMQDYDRWLKRYGKFREGQVHGRVVE